MHCHLGIIVFPFFKKKLIKKLIVMASRENDIIYLLSVSIKGQPEISVGRL